MDSLWGHFLNLATTDDDASRRKYAIMNSITGRKYLNHMPGWNLRRWLLHHRFVLVGTKRNPRCDINSSDAVSCENVVQLSLRAGDALYQRTLIVCCRFQGTM